MGSLFSARREMKIWAQRVDEHVASITSSERSPVEILISGTLRTRARLLDLYRSRLRAFGYTLRRVHRDSDTWVATFDR